MKLLENYNTIQQDKNMEKELLRNYPILGFPHNIYYLLVDSIKIFKCQ